MKLRLILYGLGQGLELIEKSIKSKHIIIGYMDSYARIKQYGGGGILEFRKYKRIRI